MPERARPLSVTIIGCVYLLVGLGGMASHFASWDRRNPLEFALVELLSAAAIVSGAYMVRGRDWARWLALAWIALHVVVSAFHSAPEFAIHTLFCAVLAYFLTRADASRYFRAARSGAAS